MRNRAVGSLAMGVVICGAGLLLAVAAPRVFTADPAALGSIRLGLTAPSHQHVMGTDVLGRDVLLRLVHGARTSLAVGWISVAIAVVLGSLVGLGAALGPRRLDRILMTVTDAFLAFPRIVLVLLLVSLAAPSLALVMAVLGLTGWMGVARLVRAEALSLRERDFTAAARGFGLGPAAVAMRHVLPHLAPTIITAAGLRIGGAILAEAFLSYLGLGAQEPTISWGAMIQQGHGVLLEAWWLSTFPGLALALTVLGYNLLGDGLRRHFDPRLKEDGDG